MIRPYEKEILGKSTHRPGGGGALGALPPPEGEKRGCSSPWERWSKAIRILFEKKNRGEQ